MCIQCLLNNMHTFSSEIFFCCISCVHITPVKKKPTLLFRLLGFACRCIRLFIVFEPLCSRFRSIRGIMNRKTAHRNIPTQTHTLTNCLFERNKKGRLNRSNILNTTSYAFCGETEKKNANRPT